MKCAHCAAVGCAKVVVVDDVDRAENHPVAKKSTCVASVTTSLALDPPDADLADIREPG